MNNNQGGQGQYYPQQGGFNNQGAYPNQEFNNQVNSNQGFNNQGYNNQGYNNQGYNNQGFNNQGYNNEGFNNQGKDNVAVNVNMQQQPQPYNMNPYPQINLVNMNQNLVSQAINILTGAVSVFVKQEINYLEMLTGCEQKNRYDIYVRFPNGTQSRIFRCKEESDFCMRICCHGDSRPFKLKVNFIADLVNFDDNTNTIAWMDRPYTCTCCCLARPEMTVYWGTLDNTSNQIGKVREPCKCIDVQMDMLDFANNGRYTVLADGCQCGICCGGTPCGRCSEVLFPIFKFDCENKEQGNRCGTIQRKFNGCLKSTFTDADNFEITFPQEASPEDKMMMIATALMIDFRYYNEDGDDNNGRNVVINV